MPTNFSHRTAVALEDDALRSTFTRSTAVLNRLRSSGYVQTTDLASLQQAALSVRTQTLRRLPALLQQLEANALANGIAVIWAADAEAARRAVVALATARHAKTIVRSRSHLAEEIGIDAALEAVELPCIRTELGDAISQLAGDGPSHPVFPAMHWRKEAVAALFTKQLDMPETVDVQSMASMARFKLRRHLLLADLHITGVELAVAENGVLALASDSGANRFGVASARLQVVLMGIDQVVSSLEELWLLLQLKARSASGDALAGSITLLDRPAQAGDPDGPDEVILVIVDNGRSDLLRWGYGEALACLHCGACHAVCPVYREIGGRAYGGRESGPIGAVLLPLRPAGDHPHATPRSPRLVRVLSRHTTSAGAGGSAASLVDVLHGTAFADLPQASTLCGACAAACPVGIDLPRLLLKLRGDLVQAGRLSRRDQMRRMTFRAMTRPEGYGRVRRWLVRSRRWPAPYRLRPASTTFRERWAKRR